MRMIRLTLLAVLIVGCSKQGESVPQEESVPNRRETREKISKKPERNSLETKLVSENYLRIQEGMQYDEVRLILGNPTRTNLDGIEDERLAGHPLRIGRTAQDEWLYEPEDEKDLISRKAAARWIYVTYHWDGRHWRVMEKTQFGLQ